jgi:hypothetical protein
MATLQIGRSGSVGTGAAMAAVGVLLVLLLLAVYRIADPFIGDHAIFLEYAEAQDHGALLYVDRWDPKGPALTWFFLLAGRVAGFSEVGVRLFEIGYQLAFAAALIVATRGWLRRHWLELMAPIAAIGAYYAMTGTRQLTQTEFLIAFPLFLALWLAARPWPSPRTRRLALFAAGVTAGVVVSFKIPFAPIIAVGWALSLWTARDQWTVGSVVRDRVAPAVAGAAVVIGAIALWFGIHGALDELLWAMIAFPLSTTGATAPLGRLAGSAAWYVVAFAPWLALAAAAWVRWRGRHEEWLTVQLVSWVVVGTVVILVQRFSWWDYHFTLFIVPVGLLAVRGADGLIVAARDAWRSAIAVVLALFLFATPALAVATRLAIHGFEQLAILTELGDRDRVRDYQRGLSEKYDQVLTEIATLEARGARPGPIYTFGDPLRILLWGREQAVPLSPWMWEYVTEPQWGDLPADLAEAAPVYVYVERGLVPLVEKKAPAILSWLSSDYDAVLETPSGMWYERRS